MLCFGLASVLACTSFVFLAGCDENNGGDTTQDGGGNTLPPDGNDPDDGNNTELPSGGDGQQRAITFIDDFNGTQVSESRWEFQIGTGDRYGLVDWGNGEAQYYRKENASVEDGELKISLKKESFGGKQYTSARLRTKGKFSQAYGRFEARIKIIGGTGVWPAFWLMPENDVYGGWPNSGEIDIMEIKGRKNNMSSSAVHFAAKNGAHQYKTKEEFLPSGTISDYHVYALEWEEDKMTFSVDDNAYFEVTDWRSGEKEFPAPFDQDFHIILNLACGGHFDGWLLPNDDELPAAMYVDYVKVYAPL